MSHRQISMSNIKFIITLINNNRITRKRFDLVYSHPQCVVVVVTILKKKYINTFKTCRL